MNQKIKSFFIFVIKFTWGKIIKLISFIFSKSVGIIFLTFILVNFFGGKLAEEAQKRFSDYQHEKTLKDSELKAATKVFEEVSRLMDKRIYRMEKLNWELKDNKDLVKIDKQMDEYRESLYDWNDSRNRDVALMEIYFGKDVSKYFDEDVHSAIKDAGKLLENYYYMPKWERKEEIGWEIDGRLGDLENKSKALNIKMLELIQKQKVGIFNPNISSD
ncbi:MAG: hypothetical protein HGA61_03725 [Candidatus Moranbacteria bacterium]|nr:hypothetical protein [Candidatus Moranbacteria bacterium]